MSKLGLNHIGACRTLSQPSLGRLMISHKLVIICLQVAAQNLRIYISMKPCTCCVHTVFPHEWNQCAIRSLVYTSLQVVNDWIIESEEQRVVAKAVNLPPNYDTCRSSRAGVLIKDIGGSRRIMS